MILYKKNRRNSIRDSATKSMIALRSDRLCTHDQTDLAPCSVHCQGGETPMPRNCESHRTTTRWYMIFHWPQSPPPLHLSAVVPLFRAAFCRAQKPHHLQEMASALSITCAVRARSMHGPEECHSPKGCGGTPKMHSMVLRPSHS
jgi:hypothetical protein